MSLLLPEMILIKFPLMEPLRHRMCFFRNCEKSLCRQHFGLAA